MSNTGGLDLNGFQVNGNLSVLKSDCYLDGDGSVELSGTLYTNAIVKYTNTQNGISIEQNIFNAGQIYVPSTIQATNMSTASVVVDGGISVAKNSKFYGSLSVCSGGALIVSGDQFLQQNLYIGKGGIIYINNSTPSYSVSSGSFISVGGVSIQTTTDATSYSAGGALTIAGGVAISKTLYANKIVTDEIATTNITSENLFSTNSSFGSSFVSSLNVFKETVYESEITSASLGTLNVSGNVYLNGGIITNVTAPSNPLDVANKYYVDQRFDHFTTGNVNGNFTQGQVIVAGTAGSITGYPSFVFDGTKLSVRSTQNAYSLVSTGSFDVEGGMAVQKDTYIGGNLYMNGTQITNVTAPSNPLDVANKYYVDQRFDHFTTGNVNGNFTQGQVIVAGTAGSITGYPSFVFDGTKLSVRSTQNAYSLVSTGSFDVEGGMAVQKDTYIGGNLYMNGTQITNVTAPNSPLDVANKYYVDRMISQTTAGALKGDFTQGQVIIGSTSGSVRGYPSFVFVNNGLILHSTSDATSVTSGGGFTNWGGLSVLKNAYFGRNVYLDGGIITNVTAPSVPLDVANKYYVDKRFDNFTTGNVFGNFSQGQVIIAASAGSIAGYPTFTFDGTTLNVLSTQQATGLGSGGSLNVSGGMSILKNAYFGGKVYLNNNIITNVTSPNAPLDVANKYYVDQRLANFTTGNVYGNFTRGEVIVAGSAGSIIGYTNFMFDGTALNILSTQPAIGLGSGGALNVGGGASILGPLYTNRIDVNNEKITSVALPTNPLDAVNKEYVDYFLGISNGDIRETGFTLGNNVLSPLPITGFKFSSDRVSSFEALVYLRNDTADIFTQFELNGIYRATESQFQMSTRLIGDFNSGVTFEIDSTGQINYTNESSIGTTIIYFRAITTGYGAFTNVTFGNGYFTTGGNTLGFYTSGTLLFGNNTAAPLSSSALLFTNGSLVLSNTTPVLNISSGGVLTANGGAIIKRNLFVGDGIDANKKNITSVADPIYPYDAVNKEYVDYYLGISTGDLREIGFTLGNSVLSPLPVTNFAFDSAVVSSFQALVYLKNETTDIFTQFELNGIYRSTDAEFQMSTRLIGNFDSGVTFQIDPAGQIQYTNESSIGTTIIYFRAFTTGYGEFTNVTMGSIGGGNFLGYYTSGTLLFGNGSAGPMSDSHMLFTNGTLLLTNTTPAYNLSSGSAFVSLGGVIIRNNLLVQNGIDANNQNISGVATPIMPYHAVNKSYVDYYLGISTGDIRETGFTLANSVLTAQDITHFKFDHTITSSFEALVYLENETANVYTQFELNGIYRKTETEWQMSTRLIGNFDTGVLFDINPAGQIRYTNSGTSGTTVIYFRALTTGYGEFTNMTMENIGNGASLGFYTSGTLLFGNNSSSPLATIDLLYTNGSLILGNTTPVINLTTGGVLTANGGVIIKENLFVGHGIDANKQNIANVADPIESLDAVNKEYVDYYLGISNGDLREMGFTLGNLVASPLPITHFKFDSSRVSSFESLVYLKNEMTGIYTQFELNGIYRTSEGEWQMSTRLIGNYDSGVVFTIDGTGQIFYTNSGTFGTSIIYFRALTTGYGEFTNVTMPNINYPTSGGASLGFYTSGTLLFGNDSGGPLSSLDLLFTNGSLHLTNTTPAINLTSGGVFLAAGGAIIGEKLIVGGGIDANNKNITSVADPVRPLDAVNKEYVDYFLGINTGDIREIGFTLGNSVMTPHVIPGFSFDSTRVSSFEALVYLRNSEIDVYTQFELNGIWRDYSFSWQMSTRLIGNYNSGVDFYIDDSGQLLYTNTGSTGDYIIYFRALTTGYGVLSDLNLGNYTSGTNFLGFYTSGTLLFGDGATKPLSDINLTFTNGTLLLSGTSHATNLTSGGVLVANGGAIIKDNLIVGNGIDVNSKNITSLADPVYPLDAVNKEYVDYYLGISNGDIREIGFTLGNAVFSPLNVPQFKFDRLYTSSFQALVYLENSIGIYTQFELNGIWRKLDSEWQMSTRLIGNYDSGVTFQIDPSGQIQYTNTNVSGTTIIYFRSFTTGYGAFTNVTAGNYLQTLGFYTSGTLLFGDALNRPAASSDLFFTNGSLFLSGNEIRMNTGDIFREHLFSATNNQTIPADVSGFFFDAANTSYFTAMVSVVIVTATETINAGYDLKGIKLSDYWQMNSGYIGENTGIIFNITDSGQIQYISTDIPNWVSTTIKFRALSLTS